MTGTARALCSRCSPPGLPKVRARRIALEPGGQTYFDTNATYKEIVTYYGPQVEKGFIRVSEKPGIGVEINEEGGSPRPG